MFSVAERPLTVAGRFNARLRLPAQSFVAERRLNWLIIARTASPIIKRRYATQRHRPFTGRGLKPTATITRSLRDQDADLANAIPESQRGKSPAGDIHLSHKLIVRGGRDQQT